MTAREAIGLVARREIVERGSDKTFVVSTIVSLVVIGCVALLPGALGLGGQDEYDIAVQDSSMRPIADAAVGGAEAFDAKVTIVSGDDADATLADGEIRAQEKPDDKLLEILQAANARVSSADALRDAGLDDRQAAQALSPPRLSLSTVEPINEAAEERAGFAFIAVILLYG
jgi:ABC-2 type transport system permease protein